MDTHRPVKLLIVDDDTRLRSQLERYLASQGFSVRAVADAQQMDRLLSREYFDLLILDLMLPGEDGLSICRRLRASSEEALRMLPILMLTAKGDEIDRILGLELGADDYLPKPFNPRELVARIHAILRRQRTPLPGSPAPAEEIVHFGKVSVNLGTRELTKEGITTVLTTGEFALLSALLRHPRQPLSRDKLMELARGREQGAFDRAIDVQISRLRKLVEDEPGKPRYLQTVWGYGYVFVPDGKPR